MTAGARRLVDVRMADIGDVGGKAANLGELLAAGVRVPEGVVLTAGIGDLTPEERHSLVADAIRDLGPGPFAVRSSGIAEDSAEQSYAGMFETVLNVGPDDVPAATERCLASGSAARVATYASDGDGRMAVIIQGMVAPAAAGVALTADPITGSRSSEIVTAVRGLGDQLVSGAAIGDEWVVRDGVAAPRQQPESAIDAADARRVAIEARRIAEVRGTPQDIEWAIDQRGMLWILQARPMTALPPDVAWDPPVPGAFNRAYRLGEWISEPVTPLFESWLLSTMEERLHDRLKGWIGQYVPRPYHVVVNGWYFYSLNFFSPRALGRSLPNVLWHLIRSPRLVMGLIPPLLPHAVPVLERQWRHDLLPPYQAAVAIAEARVESLPTEELPALIDGLAELAGDYFGSIAALAGAGYKLEISLAQFYRRHLADALGGSQLSLLAGFEQPAAPGRHAVASLDWWMAPIPLTEPALPRAEDRRLLLEGRRAAEEAAFGALSASPRRLRAFRQLLGAAQHLVVLREEQVGDLTLAWPVMRRAVLRIGEALVTRGMLREPEDVFFLTRSEALDALGGAVLPETVDIRGRRDAREEFARLAPPLMIGQVNPMLKKLWESMPGILGAVASRSALVSGVPASPGLASGSVRVIHGPTEFDELQPGEVLVAPLTAPAWTPLFQRAAAVVTDAGGTGAHSSIIAREYGIPAVVGCGDATSRLRTGMRVTVDGTRGNVEPEKGQRGTHE